ncbi:histidinol-phosphatase [Amaricoccus solimangrovi]|uniref:Histidinol-phosphatase n=1 Tax=Amaricoccus solimangrovi TaxID=2589815 RepID=A0A501WMX2_9RHOB|nr:histidinol-phosphatase [Amaricoccus solimangrovi]TPE48321.1 histidinol-phosphatase [Amaricoccus solimangrovi]
MDVGADLREELWATAEALADIAAGVSLPLFRAPELRAANKAARGFDPVTQADREAEAAMRAHLARARPRDGILGEELGVEPGESGLTWVLDPIDGTRAFLSGATTWGTLIAVNAGQAPLMGLIDQPYVGERFMGGLGRAAMRRGGVERPLRTRPCAALDEAILYSTFPEIGTPEERAGFEAVRDRARLTRYGFDCYGYALIALGQVDLVIEAGLLAYDVQAPQAVIEAAGGVFTDWRGRPAHGGGRVLAAGDPRLHAAALDLLARVPEAV